MEDINALDEIHKGASMGVDAIDMILDKASGEDFKKELKEEYQNYNKVKEEIEEIYPNYNEGKPHDTNMMSKVMTWSEVEMKSMKENSDSHFAELMLNGVNMGIIEGRKILNNKKLNKEVYNLIEKYVTMQEKSVENLKNYL